MPETLEFNPRNNPTIQAFSIRGAYQAQDPELISELQGIVGDGKPMIWKGKSIGSKIVAPGWLYAPNEHLVLRPEDWAPTHEEALVKLLSRFETDFLRQKSELMRLDRVVLFTRSKIQSP